MTELKLFLLGSFRLVGAEGELRLPTRKAEALLACLALSAGRALPRDTLIGLLWGERGDAQARHSLSQTLFSIRRVATEAAWTPLIEADGTVVTLDRDKLEVDVERFERLVAQGTPESLDQAAALYRGDLLEGLRLREAGFEEWLTGQRSRLRELAVGALGRLLELRAAAGATDEAVQAALRLLALDPLQESVHRCLMQLYVAQGRPAAALKQYDSCARLLHDELGVEPEAETSALYRSIKTRRGPPGRAASDPLAPLLSAVAGTAPARSADVATALRSDERRPAQPTRAPRAVPAFGREPELRVLRQCLDQALAGTRRVVFVTGDAGLGKTTLVEAFLDQLSADGTHLSVARGQCLEHSGPGEAYMPILEALGRLCRAPAGGRELIGLLARQAPTWLAQMPWLLEAAGFEALQRRTQGATRERMLREMVEAMEAITAERPLVLLLEDLHWCDPSTVDLLVRLTRRSEAARLLVIGTYRPAEARVSRHPLHAGVQELCVRGHCRELPLAFLSQAAIGAYLAARFPGAALPAELAGLVHERTDGNPLFMAGLADSWVAEGFLVRADGQWSLWAGLEELTAGVPDTLRQLIGQQLERLDPEDQELLEAASVAGMEFSTATVAAGADRDDDEVEAHCAALARQGRFLQARGSAEWPDGTIASRYGFIHDLYQKVLYDRLPAGRRARLHGRIGARLEAGYGPRARERAAELAVHFVQARERAWALGYLKLAAEQTLHRSAHREAIGHLETGLEIVRLLQDTNARAMWELQLQTMLGEILTTTEGWASAEAERAFLRARELCRGMPGAPPELGRVLYGLANLYEFRGEFSTSQALIEQRLALDGGANDPTAFLQAQELLTCSLYHRGWFDRAVPEAEHGLARYRAELPGASDTAGEMAIHLQAWAAMARWFLGQPDQALARARELGELGRSLGHPAAVAGAQAKGAVVHQLRRDAAAAEAWATTALQISTEQGFRYRAATASVLRGWALAMQGRAEDGMALLREGLAGCRETGAEMDRPHYLALLAEACGLAGRPAEGLEAVAEALEVVQQKRGGQPFFYEAELHRLDGLLRLQARGPASAAEAEASLRRALAVAQRQNSKSLELRAALSLAQLRSPPLSGEIRQKIDELYAWFAEGLDTPDLIEAKALLDRQ